MVFPISKQFLPDWVGDWEVFLPPGVDRVGPDKCSPSWQFVTNRRPLSQLVILSSSNVASCAH